jgi:hypothetical protein
MRTRGLAEVSVTRRAKLIESMRASPGNIRFAQVGALLKYEGFVLFNSRGGKTCHPADVRKLLEVLDL